MEYESLIPPFSILNAVDYGDAGTNAYNRAHTLEEIRCMTREVASDGAIPFIVGGDHSVPNGTFRGIGGDNGKNNVAFVHFDVHPDRGQEIRSDGIEETFERIYKGLEDIDLVYVSFDIDTFDMSCAPGTGSSSQIGSHPEGPFPMLRQFAATKTIVGVDFVEFHPFYDRKDQQTARLVCRTMFQFLTGIAMKKDSIAPDVIHPRIAGEP